MNKRERNYHHSGNYHNTMRNLSNSELDAVKTICEKINQKTIIIHSSFITSGKYLTVAGDDIFNVNLSMILGGIKPSLPVVLEAIIVKEIVLRILNVPRPDNLNTHFICSTRTRLSRQQEE